MIAQPKTKKWSERWGRLTEFDVGADPTPVRADPAVDCVLTNPETRRPHFVG